MRQAALVPRAYGANTTEGGGGGKTSAGHCALISLRFECLAHRAIREDQIEGTEKL